MSYDRVLSHCFSLENSRLSMHVILLFYFFLILNKINSFSLCILFRIPGLYLVGSFVLLWTIINTVTSVVSTSIKNLQ